MGIYKRGPTIKFLLAFHAYLWVALLFLIGAAWTWANRLPEANVSNAAALAAPHANFAAPSFTLTSTTGDKVDLAALKGQVVVVNFWASWGPPCRAEMPALDQVYQAKKEAGLRVLAVNQQEDASSVQAFGQQLGLSFPLLLDTDGAVNVRYQVHALPSTFIVDRRGIIRDTVIGPLTREGLEAQVNALLAEKGE